MIDVWFLDQSGFAPTLPTSYSWGRVGRRLVVPYEAPQRRRVNVVGALRLHGPAGPHLVYETHGKAQGRYDAAAHLAFVRRVAGLPPDAAASAPRVRPCVVVLDNYSVHQSAAVTAATPTLAAAGVTFYFLPPYSPELNPIETLWRRLKHQDIPDRSHPTEAALQAAIEAALAQRARAWAESAHDLSRTA